MKILKPYNVGDQVVVQPYNIFTQPRVPNGWNTNVYGYGTEYYPYQRFIYQQPLTLFAQYQQLTVTYHVIKDHNDGRYTVYTPSFVTRLGHILEVADFSHDGFQVDGIEISSLDLEGFRCWQTRDYGDLSIGQKIVLSNDLDLYMSADNMYKMSYLPNGAKGEMNPQYAECHLHFDLRTGMSSAQEASVVLADCGFTKDGYSPVAWKIRNQLYNFGQTYVMHSDTSAYASWDSPMNYDLDCGIMLVNQSLKFRYIMLRIDQTYSNTQAVSFARMQFIDRDGNYFQYPEGAAAYGKNIESVPYDNCQLSDALDSDTYFTVMAFPCYIAFDLKKDVFDVSMYTSWQICSPYTFDIKLAPSKFSLYFSNDCENWCFADQCTNIALQYPGSIIYNNQLLIDSMTEFVKFNKPVDPEPPVPPPSEDEYTTFVFADQTLGKKFVSGEFSRESISNIDDIESITFGIAVTSIAANAFYGSQNLKHATITENVTEVGQHAFGNCIALEDIDFRECKLQQLADVFNGCTALTAVHASSISQWCQTSFGDYGNPLEYAHNLYIGGSLVMHAEIPSGTTNVKSRAFIGCTSLESIEFPPSLEEIGAKAFYGCSNLGSVHIENGLSAIGESAFQSCSSIESLELPYSIASIGQNAFKSCTHLASLVFFGKTAQQVAAIRNYPWGLNAQYVLADDTLTIVEYADRHIETFDTSTISRDFAPNIKNIKYSLIGTNVTTIGDMAFSGAEQLVSVIIPSTIQYIGYGAFNDCQNLVFAEIPDNLARIADSVFCNCYQLSSATIPNTAQWIGKDAFYSCRSLDSMLFPASIQQIGEEAFAGCANLSSVKFSNHAEVGRNAFYLNSKLNEVSASTIGDWCQMAFYNVYANPMRYAKKIFIGSEILTSVSIPDGISEIRDWAFYNWARMESIHIPGSVSRIGAGAFIKCDSLSDIYIPANVASIGSGAFRSCAMLTSIAVDPNSNDFSSAGGALFNKNKTCLIRGINSNSMSLVGVLSIDDYAFEGFDEISSAVSGLQNIAHVGEYAFAQCAAAENFEFTNAITSIGQYAFIGCDSLLSVRFNGKTKSQIASMNDYPWGIDDDMAIVGDDSFTTVRYVNGTTKLFNVPEISKDAIEQLTAVRTIDVGANASTIGVSAFSEVTSLTQVAIPDSIYSIGEYAFYECTSLNAINIPSTVDAIEDFTFFDCINLTHINIPDSITRVGQYAFSRSHIASIVIPGNVNDIGENAFYECPSLTNVCFIGKTIEQISDTMDNYPWGIPNPGSIITVSDI